MAKKKPTNHKRYGHHHKKSRNYAKVYAPYLPLLVSVIVSLFISMFQPVAGNYLPYATEMSRSGLLSATNSHRSASGAASLALNSQLNNAAQAKANHMKAHDYWAHVAPDGTQPWYFISNAGYDYKKAGENLAYGFLTSSSAVQGWMNSPSHKANMLDKDYSHVGFGFINSPNYVSDGQQTIVVAMYGMPQVAAATSPAPSQSKPAPAPAPEPAEEPAPTAKSPAEEKQLETKKQEPPDEPEEEPVPINTEIPVNETPAEPQEISRASLAGPSWTLGAITVFLGALLAFRTLHFSIKLKRFLKHHPKLKKAIKKGKHWALYHPLMDSTIIGLGLLLLVLNRVVGFIV